MRKLVMFIVGLAAFALIPPEVAAATKLTSQQVANVCGSALKTETTSVSGCRKACGLNAVLIRNTVVSSVATKELLGQLRHLRAKPFCTFPQAVLQSRC
jgi:hypothetical protein